ncbi:MAG: hypothetical protein Q9220_003748 [cf. Caloplaca sp. 1 TL-2023]
MADTRRQPPLGAQQPPNPPGGGKKDGSRPPYQKKPRRPKCERCGNNAHPGTCWEECTICGDRHHPRQDCPRLRARDRRATAAAAALEQDRGAGLQNFTGLGGGQDGVMFQSRYATHIYFHGDVSVEMLKTAMASQQTPPTTDRVRTGRIGKNKSLPFGGKTGGGSAASKGQQKQPAGGKKAEGEEAKGTGTGGDASPKSPLASPHSPGSNNGQGENHSTGD